MKAVIETPRLVLREFVGEDAAAFLRLRSDPEIMRYTAEPVLESLAEARADLEAYPDYREHGYGRWACVWRPSGDVIGFCGLKWLPELGEVDVGYRFLPEFWGQGLATEAGKACLTYGLEVLGLERIVALVLPDNAASIRVLDKLGMVPAGEAACEGERALLFETSGSGSGNGNGNGNGSGS